MTQTLAIFYDAYRSLNAKKMFWIVLILSTIVAGAFACVGITERGLKVLIWQFDTPPLTSEAIEPAVFYKFLFADFAIDWWLGLFATVLALISTAGIFPDLINGGSINLLVSKPIGRLRLFFTQYAAGLLFVTLQVTLFTGACFLVIWVRGKSFEPGLFVAVPVMVCFFSYLFSVCVLLGLLTRSTLAALLLTLLFWLFIWAVGTAEIALLAVRTQEKHGQFSSGRVDVYRSEQFNAPGAAAGRQFPDRLPADGDAPADDDTALKRGSKVPRAIARALGKAIAEPSPAEETGGPAMARRGPPGRILMNSGGNKPDIPEEQKEEESAKLRLAYNIVYYVKTCLPKTSETILLLGRSLYDMADLPAGELGQPQQQQKAQRELVETLRGRSVWWVAGTSLGFEALVLALAAWIFCRRDY